jgi:outer membrane protein assembly factor BamB
MSTTTVFVCGTYTDLGEERGKVLDAITQLQVLHRSMELFGARPQQPIEVCLAEVRRSQLIVVIIGDRYGSVAPGREVSFSEAEYLEACQLGLPCLVYFRSNSSNDFNDSDDRNSLKRWKAQLARSHTVFHFRDASELAVQVVIDVSREMLVLTKRQKGGLLPLDQTTDVGRSFQVKTAQRFGDSERQLLHGLSTDSDGNILLLGDFWGSIEFGLRAPNLVSRGDRDIFLAKFNADGVHRWSKSFGDSKEQVGVGIAVDQNNNIFITSAFTGVLAFGGEPLVSTGRYSVALARFDPSGTHIWSRSFGDRGYHVPECLAATPPGGVVVAGRFNGTLDFGLGSLIAASKQTDVFVASMGPDGECLWAQRFGGPYEQQTRSIATGKDGSIAVVGVFKGSIAFDDTKLVARNENDYAGFLAVMDAKGKTCWCKMFGDPSVEQGSVVAFDPRNGDVVVAGFIRNAIPQHASEEARSVVLLARYDARGVLRWSKTFGSSAFPSSVRVDIDGRVLLTGHFMGELDLDATLMTSAGGYDVCAAIFSATGTLEWCARYGDRHHQFPIQGAFGARKSIVLAGSFHGTIDFGTGPLVATGFDGVNECAEDVFLAVLDQS